MNLSLVFPVFNEEDSIPLLQIELEEFFQNNNQNYEILLVNDGSTDRTKEALDLWATNNKKVKIIHLEQNQGHQQALIHGLRHSLGNCVVTLDSDLQDPIELISQMLDVSKQGTDIIHMQRISREGERIPRKIITWMFYRLAKNIFQKKLYLDVGDFRLMTRKALDVYFLMYPNPNVLREEIPNVPVSQKLVQYRRNPRLRGNSKFHFFALVRLGCDILRN